MSEIQFPDYSVSECVNGAYSDFVSKLTNVIDSISPSKQVRVKSNTKAWFDRDILEVIRARDKLRKKYTKSGLNVDFDMFTDFLKNT